MKELSIEKQIYLCKYHDIDTSLNLSLGINQQEAQEILEKLKRNGMYEQYRNLDEYEYEKIIKREKMNKKLVTKTDIAEEILNKYKFDKNSLTYNDIKNVIKECEKIKSNESIVLKDIFKEVAKKRKVETYIINNNCKRALNKAYEENEKIFKQNKYDSKPSLKEFLSKELNIIDNIKTQETKENICEDKENTEDPKYTENIVVTKNYQEQKKLPPILNADMIVQVPLGTILNYYYLKRIYRCYRRTSKRRAITRNKQNMVKKRKLFIIN